MPRDAHHDHRQIHEHEHDAAAHQPAAAADAATDVGLDDEDPIGAIRGAIYAAAITGAAIAAALLLLVAAIRG